MERFLQYFFDGISQGSIYALLALGLVIIYRGSGHLNFAQGEMAMISAFLAWWYADMGLSPWIAVAVSAVTAFVVGLGIERFIIRPIGRRSPFAVVVAAIGLFLGFNALAPFAWKVTIPEAFEPLFPNEATDFVRIGGAEWREQSIGVLVVLGVVFAHPLTSFYAGDFAGRATTVAGYGDKLDLTVALTRMISAIFRRGGDVSFVVEELKAVFDPQGGQWMGGRYVPSLLAAIGQVIETHMLRTGFLVPERQDGHPQDGLEGGPTAIRKALAVGEAGRGKACPRCSSHSLYRQEGCWVCNSCGYSKCG